MLATSLAAAVPAAASTHVPAAGYIFKKLNNSNDPTFNQLLGINNHNVIAGYFGSGAVGHPDKGYLLLPPYHQFQYRTENFPGSAQTQVTGLNDRGVTVGFYSSTDGAANANFGFYRLNGRFHKVVFPALNHATPPVNQLLGVNNSGIAVGFYQDSHGNFHGYKFNIFTHRFSRVTVPGAVSLTATAVNAGGSVAGFFTDARGRTWSFLHRGSGQLIIFAKRGASMTEAFGVNRFGLVAGAYTVGTSTFGFTWNLVRGFRTVNDPNGIVNGVSTTFVNGVNDAGDLVGFYVDAKSSTDGFLARP